MPAVDYRMPGGLGPHELAATLQAAFRSEKVIGVDITIYNPLLDDATLSAGRVLAGAVAPLFQQPTVSTALRRHPDVDRCMRRAYCCI